MVIAGGALPAIAFSIVYRLTADIPFWDEWGMTSVIVSADQGHWSLGSLNGQDNEHRVFFPVVLAFALSRMGGWSELRQTLFGVGILTLSLAVLWTVISRTVPKAAAPFAFLWAALLTFSLVQFEVLFWAAGLGWFLPNLCAVIVVALLGAERVSWLRLCGAFVACVVAAFSGAFGLCTLAAGGLLLVLAKPLEWPKIGAWIAGTTALAAVFFSGYNPHATAPGFSITSTHVWPAYPLFVLAYLGSPLGHWQGQGFSEQLGAFALLGFGCAAAVAIARRLRGLSIVNALPWLGLCAFAILCAMLTGYGRGGLGVEQALSSRYTSLGIDMWIGLSMLFVLGAAALLREPRIPRPAVAAVCALVVIAFCAVYVNSEYSAYNEGYAFTGRIRQGMLALRAMPYTSDDELKLLYPDPPSLRAWLRELSHVHERPFSAAVPK